MNTYAKKFIIFCFFVGLFYFWLSAFSARGENQNLDFTLSWSTDTYTPPYYLGKALPTTNSFITVTANPVSKTSINPELLIYNWLLNGHWLRQSSGQGKMSLTFLADGPINQSYEINVRILDQKGNFISQKTIFIKLVSPEIILYPKEKTLLTSFNQSVEKLNLTSQQEVNLIALPYFFNIDKITDLNFVWQLDTQRLSNPEQTNQNLFTLKIGEIGQSIIKNLIVSAENKYNPLEKAFIKKEILIGF